MMRLSSAFVVAAFAILAVGAKAIAQCLDTERPEIVAGTLTEHTFTDAAGRPEPAYILNLPVPICLRGSEDSDNVEAARTIHLSPNDDEVLAELQRSLGETVVAQGRPFGALTVHHHAPIVMTVDHIQRQSMVQPQRGSALRAELLDTVRPRFEQETGGPVEFVVRHLNVIGEWAYGEVEAQRPGGKDIDWSRTGYAEDFAAGMFDPAASDFLLRQGPSGWTIVEFAIGPTDVVWDSWRLDHNLPLALFQW
jgi:hypothetical protein